MLEEKPSILRPRNIEFADRELLPVKVAVIALPIISYERRNCSWRIGNSPFLPVSGFPPKISAIVDPGFGVNRRLQVERSADRNGREPH